MSANSVVCYGVAARASAAKSDNVTSVSCPTALMIGIFDAAMARTTGSSLNAYCSSIELPPRPTIRRSAKRFR